MALMTVLQTLDPLELAAVQGGEFSWDSLGRSVLGGVLNGAAQGVQSGQGFDGILKSIFSGGLSAFTGNINSQLNGGR